MQQRYSGTNKDERYEIPYQWLILHLKFQKVISNIDETTFISFIKMISQEHPNLIQFNTEGRLELKIDKINLNDQINFISKRETTHLNQMIIQIQTYKKLLQCLEDVKKVFSKRGSNCRK